MTSPTDKKKPSAVSVPTDEKKVIRRARSEKKNVKLYFNADTQAAIVEFQTAVDKADRNRIYVGRIMPAFDKLVENLINIHRFSGLHDTYDDLKHDCVSFLYETLGKYDVTRGTKAFSYFNVVAKNWLIIKTKQKSSKARRNVSLDDPEALSNNESKIIDEHCSIQSQDVLLERKNTSVAVLEMMYEIRCQVRTENELTCINSIITVFESIDDLDLLNKSAILLYIRELSGLTPKQLTTSMQAIKKHYSRLKLEPEFNIF